MNGRLRIAGAEVTVSMGTSLFDAAESVGVRVPTSCHKQGKCRECLVEIESGDEYLSARTPEEQHLPENYRLSCRARFEREGQVMAHTMRRGSLQIEEGSQELMELIELTEQTERSPRFTRRGGTLYRDGERVGTITGAPLGIALDLGTTTVVLRLENLETGAQLATLSFENPQCFGGSDIMSRIHYDSEHKGRLLQRVLLGYLSRALDELPCDRREIVEVVVAANTTMRDLLFGLDVWSIGQLPYRSSTEYELLTGVRETTSLEVDAARLRLDLHPRARIYSLPLISSHVGADAAACLVATGIAERSEVSAVMDIGTNTEVLIGNRDRILAASCPAGPAFEGGGVSCGVPGLEGAIERVRITDLGAVEIGVIGDGAPIGLCGSALIDLLSELRRTGRLNPQGRYLDDCESFEVFPNLSLTEPDINELAQAKGANAAGIRIVAHRFGIDLAEIDTLYLAGGFGRHIDPRAAARIGLIPDLDSRRVRQVGNAALAGASRILHSVVARDRLEQLVKRVEHVALESQDDFFDYFVDGCQFEPFASERIAG